MLNFSIFLRIDHISQVVLIPLIQKYSLRDSGSASHK